jgi:hypothetical protein
VTTTIAAEEVRANSEEQPDAAAKTTSDMSFSEKMAQRAKRFGLPVTDDVKKEIRKERFGGNQKGSHQKKTNGKKRQSSGGGGEGGGGKKPKQTPPAKNKKQTPKKQEKPILSKEEIEKRLARAAKYGTTGANVEELKAMLRKHRFNP